MDNRKMLQIIVNSLKDDEGMTDQEVLGEVELRLFEYDLYQDKEKSTPGMAY